MDAAGEGRIGLTVDDDNVAAVALYKSLGFSEAM
jgi:ribosomal protein S18 acetylase RimI-like enzyme